MDKATISFSSIERVALDLTTKVLDNGDSSVYSKEQILQTYAECLKVVKGQDPATVLAQR